MKIKTLRSIREAEPAVWNSIVGRNRLICRHEYLLAVESGKINDCRYFYPMVYDDDGRLLAHACLYYISTELDSFAQGFAKKVISGIRKFWKSFMILRSIECGTPVALGNTISFADGVDAAAALAAIVREAEEVARSMQVKVVLFRDFFSHEKERFDQLMGFGYRPVGNLPTTHLAMRWQTFDEYLEDMRRPYRKRIQRDMRALSLPEVDVEVVTDFAPIAGELVKLWDNVFERAKEYKRERLTAEMFIHISDLLAEKSAVLVIKVHGQIAAFALLLYDDDVLIPLFCGIDYRHNEKYSLYMNLMNFEVKHAIERQARILDLGITTLRPKQEMGAEVEELLMYMKHLNPLLGGVIPAAFRLMTPASELAKLRVFKHEGEGDDSQHRRHEART